MASWQVNQLKYAFGIGGLMSFYGIVSMITWLAGDRFGYTYTQRIVIIVLVLLTLPIALVTGYAAKRRSKKKEVKEAEAKVEEKSTDDKAQKLAVPTGNYDDLSKSSEEVIQFLKSSNLGENGKEAVYSLPWYVVAGLPKSGKSSLVLGSNLDFQNLPSQRESEQKFIRSTRNIDWRVTSDAVFVDTAGRYQTEGIDGDEWAALLEVIKKSRPKRPLDGFLLAINANKILSSNEQEIEQNAKILRTRLDEAMQRLKVRFPVYLVFTNADSIEGFRDSFSTSKNEGKNLVWGATIPLEKSENAQTMFDGEYEILHNSLMKRRLMRLSAPFPPVRQLRIFNFPLHFGSARRKIGAFVSTLFRPNPFSESPFLRGFYFTAAPSKSPPVKPGQTLANVPQTLGNTYFTERFFRDVLLRDKDIVRTFQQQKQKPPILGWVLTSIGALLVFGFLVMAGVSLYKNKQLLDEAETKGEAVLNIVKSDAGKNPLEKQKDDVIREMNATNDLREVMTKIDDYDHNGVPLDMRFGMYSGNRVYNEGLLPIYFSVIEQRYRNPTVERLKKELEKFANTPQTANPAQLTAQEEENLGKNYDLLKAYLMLTSDYKDKAEPSHISNTLKDYWVSEAKVPAGMELIAQQQLDFWAKQVPRQDAIGNMTSVQMDKPLVEAVRKKLQAFPPVFRYYKEKVTEISKQVDENVGQTTVQGILTRSGANFPTYMDGTYTIPSAYTLEGYKLMKTAIDEADTKLNSENWVMGDQNKSSVTQTTDAGTLEQRYLRDYSDNWKKLIQGTSVKFDKANAAEALQAFSSANSPMKILMMQIARNTNFSAKPTEDGWWEWIKSFFSKKVSTETGGSTQVEKDFLPLFTFVGKEEKTKAPLDDYQSAIGAVSNKYSSFSAADINQLSVDLAKDDNKKFTELKSAETKINGLLNGFNTTSAGQELASLLKEPIDNLNSLLGTGLKEQLDKAWRDQLLPSAKEAEKGFPFEDADAETDLPKLTAYLNPVDGKLSKFYDDRLKKYFDGNPGSLKLKETNDVKFSDEFVNYLNSAFQLREALYGKNAAPNFSYQFTLKPVDKAIIEGTIDGQSITSEGTEASKLLKFPADTSASGIGVYLKLIGSGDANSTLGSSLANTSAPNVNSASNTNSAPSKNLQNSTNSSSNAVLQNTGTWGLFKFFNSASSNKEPSGEYVLNFKIGGKTATAIIKPGGGDLFNKDLFKSVRAPEKLLKP
ncbi:MAG: type VI secretion system membrane subunit TssM [Acidobacteriota bacterium]